LKTRATPGSVLRQDRERARRETEAVLHLRPGDDDDPPVAGTLSKFAIASIWKWFGFWRQPEDRADESDIATFDAVIS